MGMDIRRAYSALDMPPAKYLTFYALPLVGAGVLVVVLLGMISPGLFEGPFALLYLVIPFFFFVVAAIYPYTVAESRKQQIDHNIHFFITHMGVLATSQIPRSEIMRMLSEKKEYGALAIETRKIYALVDSWNMSLAEACRFVSKRTPSEIFGDFLDRFAYSLDSGEALESFLTNEQIVVMEEFAAIYKGNLYELENMKGLFNSMMMSLIFIVIFAILMPVITGIDATVLMAGALFMVGFIEVVFVFFTKAKAPTDPIWHDLNVETAVRTAVKRALPWSMAGCVVALLLALNFTNFPVPIVLAIGLTPLLYTGFRVGREEERVKRREDSYAAFMRSLGASASARGGAIKEVLRHLQNHDFGPLTEDIRHLYQRVNMRVDDERAWAYFAADCGSNLIEKYTRMFVEGLKAGGKPDAIGRLISDNFVRILVLRKARYQTASSFRGLLYGLIAGMAFSLFVGVSIVGMLQRIFQGLELPKGAGDADFVSSLFSFEANIPLISFLVMSLLLIHAMSSSLMIKAADGGNYFRAYSDFVGLFWVAAIVSAVAQNALTAVL